MSQPSYTLVERAPTPEEYGAICAATDGRANG